MPQPGAREAKSAALSLEKRKFSISKRGISWSRNIEYLPLRKKH
jgi:hypothetical protein